MREKELLEARLLQKHSYFSSKSRKILKQANRGKYDSYRDWSQKQRSDESSIGHGSMDEGVRVLGRGTAQAALGPHQKNGNSSFDDIDEHPARNGLPSSSQLFTPLPASTSSFALSRQPLPPSVSLPFNQMFSSWQGNSAGEIP